MSDSDLHHHAFVRLEEWLDGVDTVLLQMTGYASSRRSGRAR